jgi:hypothetical protein
MIFVDLRGRQNLAAPFQAPRQRKKCWHGLEAAAHALSGSRANPFPASPFSFGEKAEGERSFIRRIACNG